MDRGGGLSVGCKEGGVSGLRGCYCSALEGRIRGVIGNF